MRAALDLFEQLLVGLYETRPEPSRSIGWLRSRPTARRERCLAARLTQRLRPSDVVLQHSARAKCPWRRASSYIADRQDGPVVAHPVLFSPRDPGPLVGTHRSGNPSRAARCREHCFSGPRLPTRGWTQWIPATSRAG